MNNDARTLYNQIQKEIGELSVNEFLLSSDEENFLRSQKMEHIIKDHLKNQSEDIQTRILAEIKTWGPLFSLISDEEITEIIVNGPNHIWFEKKGRLHQHDDSFFSDLSFRNCLERICQQAESHISVAHPCADGRFFDFRLSLVGHELTQSSAHFCLRRHPKNPWTFQKLTEVSWCESKSLQLFRDIIKTRKNFLVIGATGSGKTSVLNSFLNLLPAEERVLVIEDTSEIVLPNSASMKLLTREDPQELLPSIDQNQLVKRSLRLRPDRIVMGEIRGAEAKDFLMALSTGHTGSFGTLHAQDVNQALIRLEMLIQMAAPQWSLVAIRRLIQLSLDYVIVTEKTESGHRRLKGVFRLCSLEDHGFLVEPVEQL